MPKAKAKPIQPVAPTPPSVTTHGAAPTPVLNKLKVFYDRLEIDEYSTTSPKGPLSIGWQKMAMGWETEKQYQARKVLEFPDSKPEGWIFGDVFHCKNLAGVKVRTNNNAQNRPFDEQWCEALVHTILFGQWAGPHTFPGETVNCEIIRISKYGRVVSGQHQMTACILAGEQLAKDRAEGMDTPDRPKYPAWRGHEQPFLETVVAKGMSEDPRVLLTVDYVKPRTAADVFYTSELFKASTPPERKELCRMLANAAYLLWTRTATKGYRTHPEIVGFLDRHKRLLDCVLSLYAENSPKAERKLSKLRLGAGNCSALMYLMGCGSATTTDKSDEYRNMQPPTEGVLDWSLWEKAKEFWALLAGGRDFMLVRTALGHLVDSTIDNDNNQGLGGRWPEKMAVLDKAWQRWVDHPVNGGPPFDQDDLADGGLLSLSYSDIGPPTIKNGVTIGGKKLPNGEIRLIDIADFRGIDYPEVIVKGSRIEAPDPVIIYTDEEMARMREEALARRQQAK